MNQILQKIISFVINRKNQIEEECERLSKWGRVPEPLNTLKKSYSAYIATLDRDENLKNFLYPEHKAIELNFN